MRSRFELTTLVESHRRRMGLTQADLAARVGVSRQWINSLEAAESNPSFSNLVAVLQVLGLQLEVGPAEPPDTRPTAPRPDLSALVERHRNATPS